jgi:hypothetical protein
MGTSWDLTVILSKDDRSLSWYPQARTIMSKQNLKHRADIPSKYSPQSNVS